jgi:hypothetical protein
MITTGGASGDHPRRRREEALEGSLMLELGSTDSLGRIECHKVTAYTSSWTVTSLADPSIVETLLVEPPDLES